MYRAATFATKREAKDWAMAVESQLGHVATSGFAPVPKTATLGDLVDKYRETVDRRVLGAALCEYALGSPSTRSPQAVQGGGVS